MTHTFRVLLVTAAIAGAAAPVGSLAQTPAPAAPNQAMMHGMQGQTQGQGMQHPTPGQPPYGPQSQMGGMAPGQPPYGPQSQMGGGMKPGMMMGQGMQGGMPMMQMMMQGRMGDMPSEHIEGRIAFLHAELKITSAQMPAWTEFANVLRVNAKRLSDVGAAAAQRTAPASAIDRLDDQERWLSARLEGVRALKPAYAKLHAVLDDGQKAMADELVKAHAVGR